jgi:DNA-binding NarL/FixJ family response regulator
MRIVIADDATLIREGTARLLQDAGFDVIGKVDDAQKLIRAVAIDRPDVAIIDIKMPPTHTNEGLLAAQEIRRSYPDVGVLILSQYLESGYAMQLLEHHPQGVGYLLKERVSDVAVLADAIRRVAESESVLDPTIVAHLLGRPRRDGALDQLTAREREVLVLIAEGRSNSGISQILALSPKTVEGHIGRVFSKLDLDEAPDYHRRVLAVLAYLRG